MRQSLLLICAIAVATALTACSGTTEIPNSPDQSVPSISPKIADEWLASGESVNTIFSKFQGDAAGERTNKAPLHEVRAVWISYLDLAPILLNKTADQFTKSIREMFDNCTSIGLTTVIVQVRPFSDSFYPSQFFPWSEIVTGTLGEKPSFDPLEIMVTEAKNRKLKIEAWINPMRGLTPQQVKTIDDTYPIRKWLDNPESNRKNLILFDGRLYYNPASAEVRRLIAAGAAEIAEKYDVDSIHIDDYFYPPSLPFSYDEESYHDYVKSGGSLNQAKWRQDNTSQMVFEMNAAIKAKKKDVQFGISPRGVNSQNEEQLYIDVKKWASTPGYCDYLAPQLYYGFKHGTAAYEQSIKEWNNLITCDQVQLLVGLAAYKVGQRDPYGGTGKDEWVSDHDILAHQIDISRKYKHYNGMIFFRYEQIFHPTPAAKNAMEVEKANFISLLK
ncbi:MAG: family 10 glycosylhydrolase [Oscillospiraceae bacterium]